MHGHVSDALPGIASVKLAQGHRGHSHFVTISARQEAQPENLKAMKGGHAVEFFIHGAHQHLPPEAINGFRRLRFF